MTGHKGSCHCGAIMFEIDAEIVEFTTCDCSLCAMRNAVMTRVHESQLTILQGDDRLTLYRWNTGVARHYFCRDCGIYIFHRKRAMPDHYGVNAFCLHDLDRSRIPVRATDGKDMTVATTGAQTHWPGPRVDPPAAG
ncbi:MAG: GFA family protein [Pseudomonadota bacterium]